MRRQRSRRCAQPLRMEHRRRRIRHHRALCPRCSKARPGSRDLGRVLQRMRFQLPPRPHSSTASTQPSTPCRESLAPRSPSLHRASSRWTSAVSVSASAWSEAEAGFGAPPTSSAPPPAPLLPHAMPPPPPMPPPTLRPLAHRRCSAVPASNGGCGGGVGGSGGCRSYGWLSTALVDQRRRSPAAVPAATSHAVAARDRCSAICPPLPSPPAGAGAAVWVVG